MNYLSHKARNRTAAAGKRLFRTTIMMPLLIIPALFCSVQCIVDSGHVKRETVVEEFVDGDLIKTTTTESEVVFPPNMMKESSAMLSDSQVVAGIGETYPPPEESTTEERTVEGGIYLAGMFGILAVVSLIARFKVPWIPLIAPVAFAGAAVVFFALPTLLKDYSAEIGIALAAAMAWGGYEAWHQRKLQRAEPPKPKIKEKVPKL